MQTILEDIIYPKIIILNFNMEKSVVNFGFTNKTQLVFLNQIWPRCLFKFNFIRIKYSQLTYINLVLHPNELH